MVVGVSTIANMAVNTSITPHDVKNAVKTQLPARWFPHFPQLPLISVSITVKTAVDTLTTTFARVPTSPT